jgi:hypothetical protein
MADERPGVHQWSIRRDVVCFGYTTYVRCFLLPIANYCDTCQLRTVSQPNQRLIVFQRFVDEAGHSAFRGGIGDCDGSFTFSVEALTNRFDPRHNVNSLVARSADGHLIVVIDMVPRRVIAEVDSSGVELAKAKYLIAIPALSPDIAPHVAPYAYTGNQATTNIVPEAGEAQNGCALLDDAVLTSLATRSKP